VFLKKQTVTRLAKDNGAGMEGGACAGHARNITRSLPSCAV
jgi:hypothetical protein